MAKVKSRNLVERASVGVDMVVRDTTLPRVTDTASPDYGEYPALLGIDGKPATLRILGPDSPTARKIEYEDRAHYQNLAYARMQSGAAQGAITASDVAEESERILEKMVRLTVGWTGWEDDNDNPVPFSSDGVRELYTNDPSILEQARTFQGNRRGFFGTPSVHSEGTANTSSD